MRLNLGCGDDRQEGEGWVNVDLRPDVADIVSAADDLGWQEAGTVDAIHALDLLEHFWRDDVEAVLAEWHRVLKPGGLLQLRVPNLLALAKQLVDQSAPVLRGAADGHIPNTIENIYGGHRFGPAGSWDAHHWGYTPRTLERLLERSGFTVLSNDRRANMTLVCQKEGK